MRKELLGAINLNKGKEVKINYESLKNHMRYEDIFYEVYLMPILEELNLEHRFQGEFIIIKKKES